MYMITEAEGKIRIPPSKLGEDINSIVGDVARDQFEGKMEQDRSLTILVDNVRAEGDGRIVHGDGAVHQTVKYDRLAYIPKDGEVVEGNSFIFNHCKFMYSPVIMLNGGTNNYIAILNPNIDSNLTKPISLTGSGNSYSIFAADTSVYDVDIVKGTDVTNSIYYATLSELSDENYLMSINFIP